MKREREKEREKHIWRKRKKNVRITRARWNVIIFKHRQAERLLQRW